MGNQHVASCKRIREQLIGSADIAVFGGGMFQRQSNLVLTNELKQFFLGTWLMELETVLSGIHGSRQSSFFFIRA